MTKEQTEVVRLHMRDTYDVAPWEWDSGELELAIYELITKNQAKNNEVLDLVSKSFIIEWDDEYVNRSGTMEYLKCDDIPKAINEFIKENPDCTITAVK